MNKILILANMDIGLYNFRREIIDAFINDEYEVHIALPYGERIDDFDSMGCIFHETEVDRRGMNPPKDVKLLFNYQKLMWKIKPDVVLTYTIKPNLYGGLIARINKIPYFSNITGIGSALQKDGIMTKILLLMYRIGLKKSEIVFFQNKSNMCFFETNRIEGKNKELIPGSGVNLEEYPYDPVVDYRINNFLFVGRIMKEKGIEEYLFAAKEIQKKYSNCTFTILGDFDDDKYRSIIDTYHQDKIINYVGFNKDVKKFLKASNCIVLPSYHEGMSNTLLESAAIGRALIASDINGCKEIIDNQVNGFLVNKEDKKDLVIKIEHYINLSDTQKKEMGFSSRVKVEKEFNRNIIVKRYRQVINELVRGTKNDKI